MMKLAKLLLVLSVATLSWAYPVLADGTVDEIAANLMCQCGCTMVLSTCTCGTADQMRGVIKEKLAEGQAPQQIIDYFVAQYGEKALAAPTKQGFNLTAWLLPFAAILAGGGGIYFLLRKWVLGRREEAIALAELPQEAWVEYEDRLQKELEQYG
jgi:cytochrome c-type biogenesis protein CcmH